MSKPHFIGQLSEQEKLNWYLYLSKEKLSKRERKRFAVIFLSATLRVPVRKIAEIVNANQTTIKNWLIKYEAQGFEGLLNKR